MKGLINFLTYLLSQSSYIGPTFGYVDRIRSTAQCESYSDVDGHKVDAMQRADVLLSAMMYGCSRVGVGCLVAIIGCKQTIPGPTYLPLHATQSISRIIHRATDKRAYSLLRLSLLLSFSPRCRVSSQQPPFSIG